MKIIIGAGRVGASLVENLVSENNDITIIDTQESLLGVLGLKFDIRTILGNGSLPSVLAEAGAQSADMVIAVTFSDNTNLVACKLAETQFHVPLRIARLRASDYSEHPEILSVNAFAVNYAIAPEQAVTSYICKLIEYPEALQVLDFANGMVKLIAVQASIGYFDSAKIEAVLMLFMLIAAINFATHYVALCHRSLKPYLQNVEVLPMLGLIAVSIAICILVLLRDDIYSDPVTSFRHTAFNLISIATDCGFVSVDYDRWPAFVPWWMLYLSCVTAACTGSTGGGIKMFRTLLLWRQAGRELMRILHPHAVNPLRIGVTTVANRIIFAVLAFIFLYFTAIVILTFLLIFSGMDPISGLSAIIATINNAGPGLHQVGPATNYASLSDFQTWICTIAMLLGRLEIFTLLVLFTPIYWRK